MTEYVVEDMTENRLAAKHHTLPFVFHGNTNDNQSSTTTVRVKTFFFLLLHSSSNLISIWNLYYR
jgi:hypothetical protein